MPHTRTKTEKLRTPKIFERVVSISMFNLGRKGKRIEGFSDPAKRMAWVKWDNGEVEGEFLKDLVAESDYPKTALYQLMVKK